MTDWSTFLHTFPSNSTVFVSFFKNKKKNCIQREPFHFKYNKPSRNVHQPGSLKLELLLEECLKPFSMSPPESEWICLEINKIISIWHAFKENQCPNQIHHRKNMTTGEKKKLSMCFHELCRYYSMDKNCLFSSSKDELNCRMSFPTKTPAKNQPNKKL